MLEIGQRSPRQIQKTITFDSNVRLRPIAYGILKIGQESPWQIQTAITFDLDVQLRPIVYRNAQN